MPAFRELRNDFFRVRPEPRLRGGACALVGEAPVLEPQPLRHLFGARQQLVGIGIARGENTLRKAVRRENDLHVARP